MDSSVFHFANNTWLWGLAIIPLVVGLYARFYRSHAKLEQFADAHLLPHLLAGKGGSGNGIKRSMLLWSLLWACGIFAMAGPRWNYTDVDTFKSQQDIVILLDLSKSMDAQDVKPSRIALAREQIDNLIRQAHGISIGLVAYAADAHVVSPITDDTKPILDMLPSLDTTLPYIQGNAIKPALALASRMLAVEPGNNKAILILSDGDFTDKDIPGTVDDTVGKNTIIYTLGTGTKDGAPVADGNGGWVKSDNGTLLISHLQTDKLNAISTQRGGLYAQADYNGNGIRDIVSRLQGHDKADEIANQKVRQWEEHFTLLVCAMAVLMLSWFRKGKMFPVLAFVAVLTLTRGTAYAEGLQDLFLNKPQQAQEAFNQKNFKKAEELFDTPYRRGVAQYKAGEYTSAEQSFAEAQSSVPEAQYNLGNAQVMNGKYKDAVTTYEAVMKRDPANANAKHNLDIAQRLLGQQQKQDQQQGKNQEQGENQKDQEDKDGGSSQDKSGQNQSETPKESSGQQKSGQGQEQNAAPNQDKDSKQSGEQGQNKNDQKDKDGSPSQDKSGENPSGNPKENSGQQKSGQGQEQTGQQPSPSPEKNAAPNQDKDSKQRGKQVQAAKDSDSNEQTPEPKTSEQKQQPVATQSGQSDTQTNAEQKQQPQNMFESGKDNTLANKIAADQQIRPRTQKDIDADQWLNRIDNDPKLFLRRQFMIESEANGTQGGKQ